MNAHPADCRRRLLLALGLVWFRLRLSVTSSRIALWCLIYSTVAILAAYTVAAIWGVGPDTIRLMGELPHGLSRGTAGQETFIAILAYSSALKDGRSEPFAG
jgi:hydroxylaminobenzene mutase